MGPPGWKAEREADFGSHSVCGAGVIALVLLRQIPRSLAYAARRVFSEEWLVSISSLAFATMLSIVPFTLIGLGFFPQFAGYHATMERLRDYVLKAFVPGVGALIEQHFDEFAVNASSLPAIGIVGLFLSSGLLLLDIHSAFHKVWAMHNHTPWGRRLLEIWALLTIPPILAVSSDWLIISILTPIGSDVHWLTGIAPYLLVLAVFFGIYIVFAPKRNISLWVVALGAFLATFIFFIAKMIFIYYISEKTIQNVVYGALAVIPMVQLWVFIFWLIVIFGALFIERLDANLAQCSVPAKPKMTQE